MSIFDQYALEATITLTNPNTEEMFRYDGGEWIEYCGGGINNTWEPLIYVWDDEEGKPYIPMDIEEVAIAVISFLSQIEDEEA